MKNRYKIIRIRPLPLLAAALLLPAAFLAAATLTFQPPTPTSWFQPTFDTTEDGQPVTKSVWLVSQGTHPNNPPLPNANDVAVISNARHVIINAGAAVADTLRVANNASGGKLDVFGGTLEARLIQVSSATVGEGPIQPGILTLDGGGIAAGTRLQLASNNSADAVAQLIYRSGTGIINALDIGTVGTGILSLEGSSARDFVPTNVFLGGGREGRLRFVLDADGAPLFKVNMAITVNANAVLEIDGRAYRGETATLQLVQATNINGALASAGGPELYFPSNYTVALRQEVGNLFLDITRTGDPDPEPESFWKDEPDLMGFKETALVGWLYDAWFPWVYSSALQGWLYIDFATGSAASVYAYDIARDAWLRLDAAFHGMYWNYRDAAWQRW